MVKVLNRHYYEKNISLLVSSQVGSYGVSIISNRLLIEISNLRVRFPTIFGKTWLHLVVIISLVYSRYVKIPSVVYGYNYPSVLNKPVLLKSHLD